MANIGSFGKLNASMLASDGGLQDQGESVVRHEARQEADVEHHTCLASNNLIKPLHFNHFSFSFSI